MFHTGAAEEEPGSRDSRTTKREVARFQDCKICFVLLEFKIYQVKN